MKSSMLSLLLCMVFFPLIPGAQDVYYPFAAGSVTDAQFQPIVANAPVATDHPAMLSLIKGVEAALSANQPYLLKELGGIQLSAAFNDGHYNGVGLWVGYQGGEMFNERRMGVSYARNLGKIQFGIKIQHFVCHFNRSDKISLAGAGLSSLWQISQQVNVSMKIENPSFPRQNNTSTRLAGFNSLGVGWLVSENCYLGCEVKKPEGRPVGSFLLLKYQFADRYYARLAWNSSNHQPFLSLAWKFSQFIIETGFSYHAVLGMSPALLLLYKTENSTEK